MTIAFSSRTYSLNFKTAASMLELILTFEILPLVICQLLYVITSLPWLSSSLLNDSLVSLSSPFDKDNRFVLRIFFFLATLGRENDSSINRRSKCISTSITKWKPTFEFNLRSFWRYRNASNNIFVTKQLISSSLQWCRTEASIYYSWNKTTLLTILRTFFHLSNYQHNN